MKRLVALLLAMLTLVSLCSCTNSSDDSNNDASDSSITSNNNESVSEPQPFEVTVSAENTTTNGKPVFEITSNLPDGTELLLTLENSSGFTAQDKITLQNGQGKSSTFSAQGNSLSGTYTLKVTMGMPSLQNQSVQDVIGSKGEYMTGNIVKESSMAGNTYNSIEAEFSFDIEAETQETTSTPKPTYTPSTNTGTSNSTSTSDGGTRKKDAWVCAQDIVNSNLKAPSTAEYCSYPSADITWDGGSDYTVSGYVDAENGYGSMVRTYFTVTLTLTTKGYKNGYVTFN